MIVAIDGPAGAGKSTVARLLAERLRFRYLDTGAMYRAVTWLALARGVPLEDGDAVAELARAHPVTLEHGRVLIGGEDVTDPIRDPAIDRTVSAVACHEQVRAVMRERQRRLAAAGDTIVEGRDIGTVVCPGADVKVWLVADEAERARRRRSERAGEDEETARELRRRDTRDARQMQRAADAVEIDTTSLTIDEVADRIERLVAARVAST
jgi:cytidylate kinase